jgi:Ca2+-binding RTX toxin-like protein
MALLVGRAATACVVGGVALILAAAPALAVVTAASDEIDTVTVESDDPADVVSVGCVADQADVYGTAILPAPLLCDDVARIRVDAAEGAQSVNLGGLTLLAFPHLARTSVDVADTDADSVTGSEARDVVEADSQDEVTGGGGDDWIEGAGTAHGGDGSDVLREVSGEVQGGPGDDRIVSPGEGPIDGGDGHDVVVADYTADPQQRTVTLFISDVSLGPVPGLGATTSGIEEYDVTTSTGVKADTIDSSAFSGVLVVSTLDGNDTVRGGPGSDLVDGGPGDDTLDPGPGADIVRGGPGNDTISVRDGYPDVVDCGDGYDTVTADRADALVNCESVALLPPDTGPISGPKKVTKGPKVSFSFGATVAGSSFECALDAGAFKACASPFTVKTRKLKAARHTLTVRAAQPAGNLDPTPSTFTFKVKAKKKRHHA